MATRTFCDLCTQEIEPPGAKVIVSVRVAGKHHEYDACRDCYRAVMGTMNDLRRATGAEAGPAADSEPAPAAEAKATPAQRRRIEKLIDSLPYVGAVKTGYLKSIGASDIDAITKAAASGIITELEAKVDALKAQG